MRSFFKQFLIISTIFASVSSQLVIPQVVLNGDQKLEQIMEDPTALPIDDFIRGPMLSDQLSLETDASIFFSYARESAKIGGILSGMGEYGGEKFTVFVPTNKAVMALAKKPNQLDHGDVEISDEEADIQSLDKVERWVSAHIVPGVLSLDKSSAGTHQTLLDDKPLTLSGTNSHKTPEWLNWHVNSDIAIIGQREASNGILYMIQGTIEV